MNEARFRALIENSWDAIALFAPDGTILYGTPSTTRILGYDLDEFVGRNALDLVHGDDRMAVSDRLREILTRPGDTLTMSAQVLHKDGTYRALEGAFTNLLQDPSVGAIVNNYRDVTDRRRVEEQLRQGQKMEAVGQLAGGVAHDFNNLLTVIRGRTELLLARVGANDPLRRDLELIGSTTERAAQLVRQLLAFSRKHLLEPRVLDLNAIVTGMASMLQRLIGEAVELVVTPGASLWRVRADRGQMEQVVVNLAVNARDAMPAGGRLTLGTANIELGDPVWCERFGVAPGRYVALVMTDTGSGMDADVLGRIFEPFFTTKPPGKGTGLGLSTVYGIVKQSAGAITVASERGRGSTFTVYLPAVDDPVTAEAAPAARPSVARGRETVLLVEDEPEVRELAREVLEEQGYRVLEAADGGEALAVAERHRDRIDLVVADVVMPRMGGPRLVERLTLRYPALKVLYISGYAETSSPPPTDIRERVLHKPFTLAELVRSVREVLDR